MIEVLVNYSRHARLIADRASQTPAERNFADKEKIMSLIKHLPSYTRSHPFRSDWRTIAAPSEAGDRRF